LETIVIFMLLVVLSYGGVHWIRQWLQRRQIMDNPSQRSSHSIPTPRGGGLAIVMLTLLTALVFTVTTRLWQPGLVYIGLGCLLALLGWRDDVKSLSPRFRFSMQSIAALATILGLGYFQSVTIPLFGELHFGVIGVLITFLWIVGLTNAFNFMDGIDGIAAGVALAGGLGWMALSSTQGGLRDSLAFWIALAIAAGSLGFLGHNWPPARVFMGDACSTFLGYSFAVLPLLSAKAGGDALLLGTTVMWIFIMDAGLTFLYRLFKGEQVFSAHRSHLYQRLVINGHKPASVSALYIFLTLAASLLAIGWMYGYKPVPALILIGLPLIWGLLSWYAAGKKHAG
jgi:Fuc2NAc and GlcNAc transferase